jgi:hypothetical protein
MSRVATLAPAASAVAAINASNPWIGVPAPPPRQQDLCNVPVRVEQGEQPSCATGVTTSKGLTRRRSVPTCPIGLV